MSWWSQNEITVRNKVEVEYQVKRRKVKFLTRRGKGAEWQRFSDSSIGDLMVIRWFGGHKMRLRCGIKIVNVKKLALLTLLKEM